MFQVEILQVLGEVEERVFRRTEVTTAHQVTALEQDVRQRRVPQTKLHSGQNCIMLRLFHL